MKTKVVLISHEPRKLALVQSVISEFSGHSATVDTTTHPGSFSMITVTGDFSGDDLLSGIRSLQARVSVRVVSHIFGLSDVLQKSCMSLTPTTNVNAVRNDLTEANLRFSCATCGRVHRVVGPIVVQREELPDSLPNIVRDRRYILVKKGVVTSALAGHATACVDPAGKPVNQWRALFVCPPEFRLDSTSRGIRVSDDVLKNCPECGEAAIFTELTEPAHVVAAPLGNPSDAMISTQYWGTRGRRRPSSRLLLLSGTVLHELARMTFDDLFFRNAVLADSEGAP